MVCYSSNPPTGHDAQCDMPYRFLITGVTGTMGQLLVKKLLSYYPKCVIVGLSRDEQKQRALPKDPRLKLKLCDIRDKASLYRSAVIGGWQSYDACFHLAALKCVDTLEENPNDAYLTNVIGSANIVDLCSELDTRIVFTSTDKAVYPINVYGSSKAIAEKLVLASNKFNVVCRYGNILGSRGSFLPVLIDTIKKEKRAYITDLNMTRFWLKDEKAADFLINCAMDADCHGLKVVNGIRSSSILSLIRCVANLVGVDDVTVEEIGMRKGEKIFEHLYTRYESPIGKDITSSDKDCIMSDAELTDLLHEIGVAGHAE